jgi:hypothetical protein
MLDMSETFDAVVKEISVPGIEFVPGFMNGQFFFQPRYYFEDQKGCVTQGSGGYYFPSSFDLTCLNRMQFLLRDAAADAYRTMIAQTFRVGMHRPFAISAFSGS